MPFYLQKPGKKEPPLAVLFFPRTRSPAAPYIGAGEGCTVRRWNCGGFLGVCALGLGLGILIAAVFPVGCLMFLVAFLLIACGVVCLKDRR